MMGITSPQSPRSQRSNAEHTKITLVCSGDAVCDAICRMRCQVLLRLGGGALVLHSFSRSHARRSGSLDLGRFGRTVHCNDLGRMLTLFCIGPTVFGEFRGSGTHHMSVRFRQGGRDAYLSCCSIFSYPCSYASL